MSKLLKLTISKVDAPIFDGEVILVTVPGVDGEMTLLANHSPLISPLKTGEVTLKKESGEVETFTIATGTLEVSNNHATILL